MKRGRATHQTVCRHFHETVHQIFTSVLLLAPVIRNRQNCSLAHKHQRTVTVEQYSCMQVMEFTVQR